MKTIKALLVAVFLTFAGVGSALAAGGEVHIPEQSWPHKGLFGTYDKAALQRGLQVYKETCANCHSLNRIAFRNLADLGYNEAEIKAFASEYTYEDQLDDAGDLMERAGKPSDYFPAPFANDVAAAASNGGAVPPDLSLIVKARHHGEDYLYALLTGYRESAPEGEEMTPGKYWNDVFPGHQISMAPPISDDLFEFADGTPPTLEQAARDVTQFLAWASEPKMEARKKLGVKVVLFLMLFAGLMYASKKKLWKDIH